MRCIQTMSTAIPSPSCRRPPDSSLILVFFPSMPASHPMRGRLLTSCFDFLQFTFLLLLGAPKIFNPTHFASINGLPPIAVCRDCMRRQSVEEGTRYQQHPHQLQRNDQLSYHRFVRSHFPTTGELHALLCSNGTSEKDRQTI